MRSDILEILTRHTNGNAPRLAGLLERACSALVGVLAEVEPTARQELLARLTIHLEADAQQVAAAVARYGPPQKHSQELLDWARQQTTDAELMAGWKEIQATGGLRFEDFEADLERAARGDE